LLKKEEEWDSPARRTDNGETPLKATHQIPDFTEVCEWATDTQSVVSHVKRFFLTRKVCCDKKQLS